jgi:hypothetical protein
MGKKELREHTAARVRVVKYKDLSSALRWYLARLGTLMGRSVKQMQPLMNGGHLSSCGLRKYSRGTLGIHDRTAAEKHLSNCDICKVRSHIAEAVQALRSLLDGRLNDERTQLSTAVRRCFRRADDRNDDPESFIYSQDLEGGLQVKKEGPCETVKQLSSGNSRRRVKYKSL